MATALQTIQEQVSAEEWQVRQDLAALYRLGRHHRQSRAARSLVSELKNSNSRLCPF
jgi:hypothetical protein